MTSDLNCGVYTDYRPQYNEGYRDGVKAQKETTKLDIERLEKQRNELLEAFKSVKAILGAENFNGNIRNTIWHSDFETLFDYMDSVLERYK